MSSDELGAERAGSPVDDTDVPGSESGAADSDTGEALRGGDLARSTGRGRHSVRGLVEAAVTGHAQARPVERAAFGMISSFALTIAGARAVTYAQERRRRLPAVRSVGRSLTRVPGDNSLRVHHYLPGMFIGFTAGGASILGGSGRREQWLSLPFGAGVALATDELRLLAGRNNPYWSGRGFVLAQWALATVASVGMGAVFTHRGLTSPAVR